MCHIALRALTIFGLFKNNKIVGVDRVADVSMTIRDATEADLPAIVAIYNASVPGRTATADTEPVSIESRRDWFRDHDPEKRPLWVAVDNEIIVGWLSFNHSTDARRTVLPPRSACTLLRRYSEKESGGNY